MPSPESVQAAVGASLDAWKRQLLDLTRRNRAINFRPLKVSTVAIVDEQPAEVFRLLYDAERTLTFAPARDATAPRAGAPAGAQPAVQRTVDPAIASDEATNRLAGTADDPFDDEEHAALGASFEPYAPDALTDAQRDTELQTTLAPDALDRSLRRIEEQARLSIEEQGVNTLFLALGLLHYTDAEGSDEVLRAPIVLLPVALRRQSARSPFVLELADDEPMVNPALAELLRRQFNLALPDLSTDATPAVPPSATGDTTEAVGALQSLFVEVQARIDRLPAALVGPRWRITNDIYLGLFSFQKLVMYKDLEANADAVVAHRLVHQLITRRGAIKGGGLGLPDDVRQARLDEEYPPERGAQVVDADGSQQRALAAAERGYDLVVEGPPGTGKSQTITNLVAQALHAGKSVLFVAEKMAALDVVHQRLQQAGLGEFCLELHSTKSSKREVIRSIASALDASLQPIRASGDAGARLPGLRATLGEYVAALHEPFGALQVSPFAAYGQLAPVIQAPRVDAVRDPVQVGQDALDRMVSSLEALVAAAGAAGDPTTHPWRDTGRTFHPQDQLDALVATARESAAAVPALLAASTAATDAVGVPPLETLAHLARVRDVADLLRRSPGVPADVLANAAWAVPETMPAEVSSLVAQLRSLRDLERELAGRFTPEALSGDHASDIAYVEERSGIVSTLFWWLDGRQRAIRQRWTAQRLPGYAPSFAQQAHDLKSVAAARDLRTALDAALAQGQAHFGAHWRGASSDVETLVSCASWIGQFHRIQRQEALPPRAVALAAAGHADVSAADHLTQVAAALAETVGRLATQLQWRTDRPSLLQLPLDQLQARLEGLAAEPARAARWGALVAAQNDVRATLAAPLLAAVEAGQVAYDDLPRAFLRAFWFAWLGRCVEERPALARFHALTHEQRVREFREFDRRVLDDNRARLVAALRARVQARLHDDAIDDAMPVLRREMAKQRNHRPIRETLQRADAAVRAIKPVFLMSPLSVAQFTRASGTPFDLVVFDEASQLPPEDAVGSIARAAQLVVVGDPKQLPPTSFFAARHEVGLAADDEEGLDVPDAESILEAFMGCGVPMSRLKWHYRSAHESLISFSNASFYDADLLTFPSVEPLSNRLGLRFEFVGNGVYEGRGLNLAEARRVADAVVQFAREQLAGARAGRRPLTLGVGTFNLRQQLAIQDLLEERRRDEPDIELFFDRARDEPFFVKNLENIQGDERDVIFLSVTYARARDGRLRQNFGPLNGENGWRRLNVLVTRARRAMRVFSSMRAGDIQDGQSRGGPLLKAFLEFAESGRLDHPSVAAASGAESPFEEEVAVELARRGHSVQTQVGVAGYRIDIAVRDPDAPGRFLLGIECDGVSYHSSETARDRDRLRQQVLEARGWTILRLWSTDWFKDRAGQMERLEQTIADTRARRRSVVESQTAAAAQDRVDGPVPPTPVADASVDADGKPFDRDTEAPGVEPGVDAQPGGTASTRAIEDAGPRQYEKAGRPRSLRGGGVLDNDVQALAPVVVHVVGVESPVHEDDVIGRIAGYWDQRVGSRIRAHVRAACDEAGRRGEVERRGEFLWAPGSACVPRDRSGTGMPADRIAPEEYEGALLASLAGGRILRREALMADARTRLGFERTGSTLASALESAVSRLVAAGEIGEGSEGYRRRG